jgi:Long-chain acyl-CoA synthetases (AMP-forming)
MRIASKKTGIFPVTQIMVKIPRLHTDK